ncbi:phosphoribosyltransferase family protein [Streptomyces sp. NPDC058603]|uniref:phosphoribosyltransferase family protein n=1 Tax=Streptomyces sp. NPDC058603 TaxID=3346551 RepID=UPI00365F9C38
MRFADRTTAGIQLAEEVARLHLDDPVVLGLPRGGIPVAYQVARVLDAPLDVIAVRKLGVPSRPELGFGAIGEGEVRILNDDVVRAARLGPRERAAVELTERTALEGRLRAYRAERPPTALAGRTVVIVDDGIATGSTASAACQVARARGAARVVLAVPVAPPGALAELSGEADDMVCLYSPDYFGSVGQWYTDFAQTGDTEVVELLNDRLASSGGATRSTTEGAGSIAEGTGNIAEGAGGFAEGTETGGGHTADPPSRLRAVEREVEMTIDGRVLPGSLTLPDGAPGVVVFAHGSGSGRHSPRNRSVAELLNRAGLGTLLFDLLTPEEERDRANVFDIPLLARRLTLVTAWLGAEHALPVCYFGASTGAAAALLSAAEPHADIKAVVCRGGRPDLAADALADVRAPTLLIVGGADAQVLDLNRRAAERMHCEHRLDVVAGATHLFEEPGALEAVADLAREWLTEHLSPSAQRAGP